VPSIAFSRRSYGFAAAVLALTAFESTAAKAGAEIKLDYDYVETEVQPRQEVHRLHATSAYHLTGQNVLTFNDTKQIPRRLNLGNGVALMTGGGDEGRTVAHVVGGVLEVSFEYPGRKILVKIATNGKNSCSASMKYMHQPGHRFFEGRRESNGEKMFSSEEHVENLTCWISSTPD
jgi:hypothetical protein